MLRGRNFKKSTAAGVRSAGLRWWGWRRLIRIRWRILRRVFGRSSHGRTSELCCNIFRVLILPNFRMVTRKGPKKITTKCIQNEKENCSWSSTKKIQGNMHVYKREKTQNHLLSYLFWLIWATLREQKIRLQANQCPPEAISISISNAPSHNSFCCASQITSATKSNRMDAVVWDALADQSIQWFDDLREKKSLRAGMSPWNECTTAITKAMTMTMSNMKTHMSLKLEGLLRNQFIIIYRVSSNNSNNKLWKRNFKRKNFKDSTRISLHKLLNHVGLGFQVMCQLLLFVFQ